MKDLNERDRIIQDGIQTSDRCLHTYDVFGTALPETESERDGIAVGPVSWQR